MSERKLIREAIAKRIVDAATAAGSRVYENRARPLWDKQFFTQLPAVLVYTTTEDVEIFNASPREYKRTLEVAIELVASGDADVDDALDLLAAAIEPLFYNGVLTEVGQPDNCLNDEMILTGSQMALRDEGQGIAGSTRLTYDVIYYTEAPEAVPVDNFDTLETEYDLQPGQEEDDRAKDLIDDIYNG